MKNKLSESYCQNNSSVDTPYLVDEPIPPIFGSKLCVKTRPHFMSKSLPDISTLTFMATSDDNAICDEDEKVLSLQDELTIYYDEARMTAVVRKSLHGLT